MLPPGERLSHHPLFIGLCVVVAIMGAIRLIELAVRWLFGL